MKEKQIQEALDYAAETLSPFLHSTAEELEKIFAVLITLDILGLNFLGMMEAVCTAPGAEEIRLCQQFAPVSSTTPSESPRSGSTTP